mmetsp:Transcript_17265/g.56492  ORF Transcript_17265/g.56492 Transcript_17265/m.56492 type:complete len:259 (+) Transcript_17265:33-809(+)
MLMPVRTAVSSGRASAHASAGSRGCGLPTVARERPRRRCRRQTHAVAIFDGGIGAAYSAALVTYPRLTQMTTSCLCYAMGDAYAQMREGAGWNRVRMLRFAVTGAGAGLLWGLWYGTCDGIVASAGLAAAGGWASLALSILLETFVWAPFFYGVYLIPVSGALAGKNVMEIVDDVQAKLSSTLFANAKVWTPANIVIYSAPLAWRVLVANAVDLVWAVYLSYTVQSCSDDEGEESCLVSKPDVAANEARKRKQLERAQ